MSNEIKKPTNEASEVSVAKYLIQQFPEWKEQLKKLVYAYEMPYKYFCEREAEFRLESLGISTTTFDYPSMVELIAEDLFKSDTFSDGEIAEQIASSVLKEDFCLDLKDEKQIAFLKENYFKSELLLALTGSKANLPFLASYVCKLNTKKTNRNMEAAFWNVLDSCEKDYITTKELQELFITFQKGYKDNQARIKIPGGELVAEENPNPEYPGICVYLELDSGDIMDLVLMENHNQDGKSTIEVYGYEDVWNEDWIQKYSIDMSEVKKVFEDNEDLQDSGSSLDEEWRMEWHPSIVSEKDYNHFVASCLLIPGSVTNYEQAARLFYHEGKNTVMVELQVPTRRIRMDGDIHNPWIDVFRVKDMQDYDASDEIDSVLHEGEISFENAKELMLQVAKEYV